MGYFKRPLRRAPARRARLAFTERAVVNAPGAWQRCGAIPPSATDTFLRFVVEHPRAGSVGLFRSNDCLEGVDDLPTAARSPMRTTYRWFNENLPVPRRLPRNAVCWFRADASESLRRLWTLVELYRLAGFPVRMQATRNPGRVVYRDEFQVAAVPYRDRRSTSTAL